MSLNADRLESFDRSLLKQYQDKQITTAYFTKRFAIGFASIPFKVNSTASGCAELILSVWDGDLKTALDSIAVVLPISADLNETEQQATQRCGVRGTDGKKRLLLSGAQTLLATALTTSGTTAGQIDAGLHVFEFQTIQGPKSYAVLAMREQNNSPWIRGWRTQSLISGVLRKNGDLFNRVVDARKNLGSTDPVVRQTAYAQVAKLLQQKIFTAADGDNGADAAYKKLLQLQQSSQHAITVLGRFSSSGSDGLHHFFVPLRLLAARRSDPSIQAQLKDFSVVHMLPEMDAASARCISKWTIITSEDIYRGNEQGDDPIAVEALERLTDLDSNNWRNEPITKTDDMVEFFQKGLDETSKHTAEGLLVIAHHDPNDLWLSFDKKKGAVAEDFKGSFPPGSVAVMGACNVAATHATDGLIDVFNQRHIQSMIVSPFAVDAAYAIRLINQLELALDSAYQRQLQPTVRELFSEAVRAVAKTYESKEGEVSPMEQQGLEFLIAGAPNVRLCNLGQKEMTNEQ
jgi:hypothetical protein